MIEQEANFWGCNQGWVRQLPLRVWNKQSDRSLVLRALESQFMYPSNCFTRMMRESRVWPSFKSKITLSCLSDPKVWNNLPLPAHIFHLANEQTVNGAALPSLRIKSVPAQARPRQFVKRFSLILTSRTDTTASRARRTLYHHRLPSIPRAIPLPFKISNICDEILSRIQLPTAICTDMLQSPAFRIVCRLRYPASIQGGELWNTHHTEMG